MHPSARSLHYKMTLHEYSYKDFSFNFYDVGNLTEWRHTSLTRLTEEVKRRIKADKARSTNSTTQETNTKFCLENPLQPTWDNPDIYFTRHTSSAFMITHTHRLMRYYHDCLLLYDLLHSPGEETDAIACCMGKNTYLKRERNFTLQTLSYHHRLCLISRYTELFDSVIGIGTHYRLDDPGSKAGGNKIFLTYPNRAPKPTQPPAQRVPGLSLG